MPSSCLLACIDSCRYLTGNRFSYLPGREGKPRPTNDRQGMRPLHKSTWGLVRLYGRAGLEVCSTGGLKTAMGSLCLALPVFLSLSRSLSLYLPVCLSVWLPVAHNFAFVYFRILHVSFMTFTCIPTRCVTDLPNCAHSCCFCFAYRYAAYTLTPTPPHTHTHRQLLPPFYAS